MRYQAELGDVDFITGDYLAGPLTIPTFLKLTMLTCPQRSTLPRTQKPMLQASTLAGSKQHGTESSKPLTSWLKNASKLSSMAAPTILKVWRRKCINW